MSVRAGEAGRQTARGRIPITRCSQIQSLAPTAGTVRHLPATPRIECLLPRAADNAAFRSAAKDLSRLSTLRRVDPEIPASDQRASVSGSR